MRYTAGRWAFIIGLIVAVISGFFQDPVLWGWILAVLGLLVGIWNITAKEAVPFLVASIALIVGGTGLLTVFGSVGLFDSIMKSIVVFVSAAALPVVFRVLFGTMSSA